MNNSAENTAETLKGYEIRVQLSSISVSTKGEKKQVQYSYLNMLYIQDVPKVCTNCIRMLR